MIRSQSKRTATVLCFAVIVCIALVASIIILIDLSTKRDSGNRQTYTVSFYSDNGTALKIDSVEEHQSAEPPVQPEMSYGNVFVRWDGAFSDVTSDMEVHPVTKSIKEENNAFALSGAYGQKGTVAFVPLQLCGKVCVSGFDLRVQYDPEFMELLSVFA